MHVEKEKGLQDSVADTSTKFWENRNKFCAAAQDEFIGTTIKDALAISTLETKYSFGVMNE